MIKPCRGYLLIEPIEAQDISTGGVYLPEEGKEKQPKGKVLAVGDKVPLMNGEWMESEVKVGQTVVYKKFIDNKIEENGQQLLLAKFEEILGYED